VIRAKESLARKQLPQHHRRGKNVHPAVNSIDTAAKLLWCHVGQLALHLAFVSDLQPALRLRDPEVRDPGDAILPHHDVLRGNVTMDDPERHTSLPHRLVRRMKTRKHLSHDGDRDGHRHSLSSGLRRTAQSLQRFAPHVLHHEKDLARFRHHIQCGNHIRMLDSRSDPRLIEKHGHKLGIPGDVPSHPLDRHGPVEPTQTAHATKVHSRHAPSRELSE
jgi:hypothetical protein